MDSPHLNSRKGSPKGGSHATGSLQGGSVISGSSKEGTKQPGSSRVSAVDGPSGTSQCGSQRGPGKSNPDGSKKNRTGAQKRKARKNRAKLLTGEVQPGVGESTMTSGTKRLRSIGSTPGSKAGQASKKARTNESSYSQIAAAGLRIAIIPVSYPEVAISEDQYRILMRALNAVIDKMEGVFFPRFNGFKWIEQGMVTINCEDQATLNWLEATLPSIKPWEGAQLTIQKHIPKVVKVMAVVHGPPDSTDVIRRRLCRQNVGLRTDLWRTFFRKEERDRVLLAFGVDEASFESLRRNGFKAYAGVSLVTFVSKKAPATAESAEQQSADPNEAGKPSEGTATAVSIETGGAEEVEGTSCLEEEMADLLAQVGMICSPGSGTAKS